MELAEWSERVERISAGYGEYFDVERTPDWTLLKLTEEVGELTQAHLALTGQGRNRGKTPEQMRADLEGEVADVLAMVLVVANRLGVDVEAALTAKWLPWEEFHARRAAGDAPRPLAPRVTPADDDTRGDDTHHDATDVADTHVTNTHSADGRGDGTHHDAEAGR